MAGSRGPEPDNVIAAQGAARGPTFVQWALAAFAFALISAMLWKAPGWAHFAFAAAFCVTVGLRPIALAIVLATPRREPRLATAAACPRYTVIVPLFQEAAMAFQLMAALAAMDYPRDRLQVLVALEDDDLATRVAVQRTRPPPWVKIVTAPPGAPRTKPRACNVALACATGEFVVVYDAEDRPDPMQLREAAARFADGPPTLACLQAPLRIDRAEGFLKRQFAIEYAALFEVMLPALAAVGLPFPLGGTSNHFRVATLRTVGGWDAYNVTEDADIGLRLGRAGFRLGVLARPTIECAPRDVTVWLPQRTRWIKGHMQTWGVMTRRPFAGGWRAALSLQAFLGLNILSSLMHGPLTMGVVACLVIAVFGPDWPGLTAVDFALVAIGWAVACWTMAVGFDRAGGRFGWKDAAAALGYWPLQSMAGLFAIWRLVASPHDWEKTPHDPIAALEPEGVSLPSTPASSLRERRAAR